MKTVNLKLGNMRKPQEFVITQQGTDKFIIQSDKSIGVFNLDGIGKLNTKGQYFPHLAFAKPYNLTVPQVIECRDAMTKDGDVMGFIGRSPIIYAGTKTF